MTTTANSATSATSFPVMLLANWEDKMLLKNRVLVRRIERNGIPSRCVQIPAATEEDFTNALEEPAVFTAAVEWYQEQIATLAKEAIAGNVKEISSASFGLAALCAKLEDAQLAAGLKPAQVTAWFDANMKATLVAAFKAKLGAAADEKRIYAIVDSYRVALLKLVNGNKLTEQARSSVELALSKIPTSAYTRYFNKLLNPQIAEIEDMESLEL